MIRPALAFLLAAGMGGALPGLGRDRNEARICASLEEAVPTPSGAVLLVFFSTGCAICFDELLEARFAVEQNGWPVAVVGVHLGPYEELRAFLEKYRWDKPVVFDRRKLLFRKFKVAVVPDLLLLIGDEVVHRSDPTSDHRVRRDELRLCLERIFGPGSDRPELR